MRSGEKQQQEVEPTSGRKQVTSNRMVSELVRSTRMWSKVVAILLCAILSTSLHLETEANTAVASTTADIRLLLNRSNQRLAKATPTSPRTLPATIQVTPASISERRTSTTAGSSTTSNLIEGILIQVRSLNLDRVRERQVYLNEPYGSNNVTTSSSNEPEEDTLELSSSLVTSTQPPQPLASTTDAIRVADANNRTHLGHYALTKSPEVSSNDPDYELIESNKVSSGVTVLANDNARRVLLSSQAAASQIGADEADSQGEPITCDQAFTECALRKACEPSLRAFNEECRAELDLVFDGQAQATGNRTQQPVDYKCPTKCLRALVGLRSSENGVHLMGCDCEENEYCMQSKSRSQLVCQKEVAQVIAPETQVSCSIASWICMSDQSCFDALYAFYDNCRSSLLSQRQCTPQCNNSLTVLYNQAKASKLINCYCDGSEEFPCEKYKTYTERYCLDNSDSSNSKRLFASDDIDSRYDENDNDKDADKDTDNDPQDNETVSQRSSNLATFSEIDDYEATGTGSSTGASESEDTSSASDDSIAILSSGKQQQEQDNWIPLVNSRYFHNLHRQPQQSQPTIGTKQKQTNQNIGQQKHTQQRTSFAKRHNATRHKSRQKKSQQQQQSNNRHLRRSRVLVYASSTSAALSLVATPMWCPTIWMSFSLFYFGWHLRRHL